MDENYVKAGVHAAGYYYSFCRAKEIHTKVVDFGTSRPFLADGVLNYKIKLGTRIVEDKTRDRLIYLKKLPNEPFICFKNKKLQAVLLAPDDRLINKCRSADLEFQIIENT